jgi:Na+/H+-translocating membrane pyrophosphatase
MVWGVLQILEINKINVVLKPEDNIVNPPCEEHNEKTEEHFPWTNEACVERMLEVNQAVKDGADTFLKKEYTYLAIFCAVFSVILVCAVDMPWAANEAGQVMWFPFTTFAFIIGAITSMVCGLIGMKVATQCNVKTTFLCAS